MQNKVYQPVDPTYKIFEDGKLNSFDVYHSKERAQRDYPNYEIEEYSGDDIEDPNFIDEEEFAREHPWQNTELTRELERARLKAEQDSKLCRLVLLGFAIFATLVVSFIYTTDYILDAVIKFFR